MRFLFLFILLFIASQASADDVNRKVCKKGLERLVVLANAEHVADSEFKEAIIVTDTLLHNKCYAYFVDTRGKVYAGASLPYLFGKICRIRKDTQAIDTYIKFLDENTDSTIADEVDYALEELFHAMPDLFVQHELGNEHNYLLPRIAWGFLNNVYTTYGALTISNYKDVFYKRYPTLKDIDGNDSKIVAQLLSEIEEIIR